MSVLWIVLVVGATFRLTRMVVTDAVFDLPRSALVSWLTAHLRTKIAELFDCPWCASIWVATAVTLAAFHLHGMWFEGPAIVLTASGAAGLLSTWE